MKPRMLASCVAALSVITAGDFNPARSASLERAALQAPPAIDPAAAPSGPTPWQIIIEPLPPPPVAVTLRNINNAETETFAIVPDGRVDDATAAALSHFLRCRRTLREKPIASGTLSLLVSVARRWSGRVLEIVSGFRAPPFGAPHSKHFEGHAIDLRVEGVKTTTLRDFVWREHREVGVGHYTDENFVHMDWRPGESDRAWSSSDESELPNYNPRWAWSARHPSKRRASASPRS